MNSPKPGALEDWGGRGITPIPYDSAGGHSALRATLERWATLSAINGSSRSIDAEVKRIVRTSRGKTTDSKRDLFDHLIRRSNASERVRLSRLASKQKAEFDWLDAIIDVAMENDPERGR